MIRVFLMVLVVVLGADVSADGPRPNLYRVVDVASDDTLNIRIEPRTSSEIIGILPYDATHVEVISYTQDSQWPRWGLAM